MSFNKKDVRLLAVAIIASAYMTIFYDIIQEFGRDPIDGNEIILKTIAGLVSGFIGVAVVIYLTRNK